MTSSYTPHPALRIDSGYLVFHIVQQRFPAFLRCQASHFLADSDFFEAEVATTPLDFRNAVARLPAAQATAAAATGGVLTCSNTDQALRFYDCVVTNPTNRPQTFDLTIEPDQVNGFFYSVQVDGQSVPPANGVADLAPGAAQFALGTVSTRESRPLRVSLACNSGGGCKTTLFRFVVTAEGGGTIQDNDVRVSTSYSQP